MVLSVGECCEPLSVYTVSNVLNPNTFLRYYTVIRFTECGISFPRPEPVAH